MQDEPDQPGRDGGPRGAFRTGNVHRLHALFTADFGSNTGSEGGPAVSGGLVFIGSADHFLYAFPAAGCGAPVCPPRWKAHLKAAVVDSSVAAAGGVANVGDFTGHLYAFTAAGCGAATCQPIKFVQLSSNQNYLGTPLAVGEGKVYMSSDDNTTGRSDVFALGLTG